jgi:hypothetical protein
MENRIDRTNYLSGRSLPFQDVEVAVFANDKMKDIAKNGKFN